ncbi:uncharacterized protein LOC142227630 [Haematobia irritans]|uniref:uncharacterized protein LOC142227630 n=1 Tax=Haematobia irritans TaxID=7368 RepID=UPI003F4F8D89
MDLSKSAASSIISSNITRESINNSSIMRDQRRRQSSVNAVSWNDTISVQHSCSPHKSSTVDESQVTMRQHLLHRRHQSVGNAKYPAEDQRSSLKSQTEDGVTVRRRSSNLWWAHEEAMKDNARRPYSWGPVGTDIFATDSSSLMYQNAAYMCDLRLLHGQCILWKLFILPLLPFLFKISKLLYKQNKMLSMIKRQKPKHNFFQTVSEFFSSSVNNTHLSLNRICIQISINEILTTNVL